MDDFPFELNEKKTDPYKDQKLNNGDILRTFSKDVLSEELVWHRDKKTRVVKVLEGLGWELQLDDKLPKPLEVGKSYTIPAYAFHRIKRGTTDLIVQIEEKDGI